MDDKMLLLVLFAASGVVLGIISIPLILEKVKPNYIYGFRVPKTINNPEIWFKANQYAGWRLLWAAAITTLGAPLLYLIPNLTLDQYAFYCLILFTLPLTVGIIQSFIYLGKL
jgi:uncharacterized membrane protein